MDSTTMNTISLPTKQTYKDAKKSKNLKHTEVSSTKACPDWTNSISKLINNQRLILTYPYSMAKAFRCFRLEDFSYEPRTIRCWGSYENRAGWVGEGTQAYRTEETAASPQAWQWKGAGVSRNMVCWSGTPLGAPA